MGQRQQSFCFKIAIYSCAQGHGRGDGGPSGQINTHRIVVHQEGKKMAMKYHKTRNPPRDHGHKRLQITPNYTTIEEGCSLKHNSSQA